MELRKLNQNGNKLIDSYDNNSFIISGKRIEGVALIFYNFSEEIKFDNEYVIQKIHLEKLLIAKPPIDILIIGHFNGLEFKISSDIIEILKLNNIKIEKMITSSACRTYNLLVSENRKVACILFPDKHC
ncbi:MAG: hypothetical protein CFH01_01881 [Alphaproteobacteria bacterium MarineAlpha2_Bin1]|nr:MAG: hypothetical protein CFH01_01881 [Alphaproteobacteria bacterium MarineAlpha2_Bin1]|tara:strand:+ start:107 stop:493 length:387 start_codon:yes stop_codon:yes gene_type:complete